MYKCPWCERKVFSFWQKQSLGPSKSIKCTACAKSVSVPWGRAHLAALPVFIFAVAGLYAVGEVFNSKLFAVAGLFAGVVIGMIVTMPLYHRYVPLVRPDR